MLFCISFVPIQYTIFAFEKLAVFLDDTDQFSELNDYFETNFIGKIRRNRALGRHEPRFKIKFWNLYDVVMNNRRRTNNALEGWNNQVRNLSNCCHPSTINFINIVKKDIENFHLKLVQLSTGQNPTPRQIKYTGVDERIYALVCAAEFSENFDFIEFLQNLAYVVY